MLNPQFILAALWIAWAAYWAVSAADVKHTQRMEPAWSRWLHLGPIALAAALLCRPHVEFAGLDRPLPALPIDGLGLAWAGTACTAGGLAFAVWARRHLGRNWSAPVTLKANHELVTHGPYAIVRHPIYTGLLLAFAGSALARADVRGVVAIVIVFAALWRKLRLEERWMREKFGPAYDDYARRVRALVPFVW